MTTVDMSHNEWKELRDSGIITLANATAKDIVRELVYRQLSVVIVLPCSEEVTTYTHLSREELTCFFNSQLSDTAE